MQGRHRYKELIVLGLLLSPTSLDAQPLSHGVHPPMPDQEFFFRCRLETGAAPTEIEVPLQLRSPSSPGELNQVVELPDPLSPIRLTRYLPQAVVEQSVIPDEKGTAGPAIELVIEGPKQSTRRWLLADDFERNRLTSFIGTWRYIAVADKQQRDELYAQFVNELTRDPRLSISRADGGDPHELPATVGKSKIVKELGCKVKVRQFFSHFALDDTTKKPRNRSNQRLNPAALVELEHQGVKEERWVFAKFPDFEMGTDSQRLPFLVRLDCPLERQSTTPDFVLATLERGRHEVWARYAGKTQAERLSVQKPVEVSGSNYTFRVERYVPSGLLTERYTARTGAGGRPALRLERTDASGASESLWLEIHKQRVIQTVKGPLVVSFGTRQSRPTGGHP